MASPPPDTLPGADSGRAVPEVPEGSRRGPGMGCPRRVGGQLSERLAVEAVGPGSCPAVRRMCRAMGFSAADRLTVWLPEPLSPRQPCHYLIGVPSEDPRPSAVPPGSWGLARPILVLASGWWPLRGLGLPLCVFPGGKTSTSHQRQDSWTPRHPRGPRTPGASVLGLPQPGCPSSPTGPALAQSWS